MPSTPETVPLPTLPVREEEARSPLRLRLELNQDERAALATRFGIEGVDRFAMKATVTRLKGRQLRAEGMLEAEVRYLCGATLVPFAATLTEEFSQIFVDEGGARARDVASREVTIDPLGEPETEAMVDGAADVAELAYQTFAMALDPFPRHPDAVVPGVITEEEADALESETGDAAPMDGSGNASPFAVLKDLKH